MMNRSFPPAPEGRSGWPWNADAAVHQDSDGASVPRISVVTPSFNQGDFLEATIRSVLLQCYPNLQYIIVDGGSADQSGKVLDKYRHLIDVVIQEEDQGQSDAINKGLALADGEFFNWINSDDLIQPGVLWELGTRMDDRYDLYTFPSSVEGEGIVPYLMSNENLSAKRILRADRYSFSQPGLWFRLERLRECGGIDATLNYGFDWDLLIRYLSRNPRVRYSSTVGALFRLHAQSKTCVESAKENETENRFRQESKNIRDKLERTLPGHLARVSRLGRLREPWNNRMIELLDDLDRSPFVLSTIIAREALQQPRARFSARTLGAIARLLSRYFRPSLRRE